MDARAQHVRPHDYWGGYVDGHLNALRELRALIQSDLDLPQHLTGILRPGLRKALEVVERMERELDA